MPDELRDQIKEYIKEFGDEEREEALEYFGADAAVSEMVSSQLPGRGDGPADAYRHLVWAADMSRRFGPERAAEIPDLHEASGFYP